MGLFRRKSYRVFRRNLLAIKKVELRTPSGKLIRSEVDEDLADLLRLFSEAQARSYGDLERRLSRDYDSTELLALLRDDYGRAVEVVGGLIEAVGSLRDAIRDN